MDAAANAGVLHLLKHEDVLYAVLDSARCSDETSVASTDNNYVSIDSLRNLIVGGHSGSVAPRLALDSLVSLRGRDHSATCCNGSTGDASGLNKAPARNVLHGSTPSVKPIDSSRPA